MSDYDVCVVGLGPTGLSMAHLMAKRGLSVLVLEREPSYYGMARAVYTDDECLRIMQNAGLADELHADMTVDLPVQWTRGDGSVLAQFHNPHRPHGWPTSNFLYQPAFETTLERRAAELPDVTMRRGRAVLEVSQDADQVTVTHQGCDGAEFGRVDPVLLDGTVETTTATYLVAADGGRSTVRTQLGIPMKGRSFPQRWLVVDLKAVDGADAFRNLPYFDFVCDSTLPTVSCPQPADRHRFEFMLHEHDSTEEFETPEKVRELLSRHVDPDEVVVDRRLVYTFNALVAERWCEGRIFLAGDAAHMTPQFIGQGMNSGIRDADNLSWKIADVIKHGADASLLDSYQTERKPHAKAMINLSVFNKELVSTGNPVAMQAREWSMRVGTRLPWLRTYIGEARMKPKPRLRRGGYLGTPRGLRGAQGTLMPQPPVRTYAGRPTRLDDELGTGWCLIGIGTDPRAVVDPKSWTRLNPTWATLFTPGSRPSGAPGDYRHTEGLVDLEAIDGQLSDWLRKHRVADGSVIVLRPDKYVLAVVRPGHVTDDVAEVREILCSTGQEV